MRQRENMAREILTEKYVDRICQLHYQATARGPSRKLMFKVARRRSVVLI